MTISRRQFVGSVAGAGIASIAAPHLVLGQNSEPIRVGLLAAKTGPLASGGIDMDLALTMFLRERENTLAGRKIEFISTDTGGNPAGAKTKAQELIDRDKVNVIVGPLAAFELLAITDYVRESAVPLISMAAAEDVRILYGGSMKPDNAAELLALEDCDGGLIGGASLEPASFQAIIDLAA